MSLQKQLAALRAENKVLKDLLETQYRETDKARAESDKADDEALEHKIEASRLRKFGMALEYDLVWALKRRLDKAEAKVAALAPAVQFWTSGAIGVCGAVVILP